MNHVKPILVALVILGMVMAGCASGGDSGDDDPVGLSDDTGAGGTSLRVLVTDDTLSPLEGATVQVRETEAQQQTGAEGVATFSLDGPGSYTVDAQKLGFESQSKRADVVADQTASVDFTLTPIRVVEAFHATFIYDGFMACGGGLVFVAFTSGCQDANHQVAFDTTVTPELVTVIDEMTWEQNTALSAGELRLVIWQNPNCDPVCSPDEEYGDEQGPSPVYVRADGGFDGIKEENEPEENNLTHQVWTPFSDDSAPFVILVIQQPFQIHATVFYGVEAPEGFSALPDA